MKARGVFFAADGRLLAPWRIAIFLVASVVCGIVAAFTIVPTIGAIYGIIGLALTSEGWWGLGAFYGATVISLRTVDKKPWSYVWLDRHAARPQVLARGLLIGGLAIGIPCALLASFGWLGRVPAPEGSWGAAALRTAILLLPAALVEELALRGYVFAVINETLGWKWALGLTSLAFGVLHGNNPGASVEPILLVVLAGVFLGAVLLATRSLYAVWMAHFAWNFVLAAFFHAAVSGLSITETPGYRFIDAGPDWATGGPWGPEGGIFAGLGMLGGLGYLYARRPKLTKSEES